MKLFRALLVGFVVTSTALTSFASMLGTARVKCEICGLVSEPIVISFISDASSDLTPDLDMRPNDQRQAIKCLVQRCPQCGYCNSSLADKTSVDKEYLSSDEYLSMFADIPEDSLAASFIRQARIAEKDKSFINAMYAYLHAAWHCDDKMNSEGAKQCRLLAIKVLEANYNDIVKSSDEDSIICLKTDMLRRAGCFEEAIDAAQSYLPNAKQENVKKILNFQIEKCKAKDANVYLISDALSKEALEVEKTKPAEAQETTPAEAQESKPYYRSRGNKGFRIRGNKAFRIRRRSR